MKVAISTLVLFLAVNGGSAWPHVEGFSSEDTKSSSCHFLDASPFFRNHPNSQTGVRSTEELEEIVLLTEFSRFMNAKAMDLLQEFAEIKKLYEVKKQFQHFHDTPTMAGRPGVRGARDLKVIDPKPEPVPTTFFKTALAQKDIKRPLSPVRSSDTVADTESSPAASATNPFAIRPGMATTTAAPSTTTAAASTTTAAASTTTAAASTTTAAGAPTTTAATAAPTTTAAPATTTASATTTLKPNVFNTLIAGASDTITQLINSIGGTAQSATPTPIWNSVCFLVWFPYHKDKCNQLRCTACTPSIMTADVVCKRASPDMKSTHKCIQNVMGEGRCNYCITDFLHA